MHFFIEVASKSHKHYAFSICKMMEEAANVRGTGIAKRKAKYLQTKMEEGKAIIAFTEKKEVVGFCYIESWDQEKYVANSGLIVHPDYRKTGLAKSIKKSTFELSKKMFPKAKLFGITTSLAVMKINSDLGYKPVTFSELTEDENFWKGCQSCPNYDVLQRTNKSMCLCTGMICDLGQVSNLNVVQKKKSWDSFKRFLILKKRRYQHRKSLLSKNLKSN
jgi:N-acetylglutamate synthase-like GNAT family acetyltransferase